MCVCSKLKNSLKLSKSHNFQILHLSENEIQNFFLGFLVLRGPIGTGNNASLIQILKKVWILDTLMYTRQQQNMDRLGFPF